MNNSELVTRLERFVATSRFSEARKSAQADLIGKQYLVSGILSRVSNTTGYLRNQRLRLGKTIILQLDDSDNSLSIRFSGKEPQLTVINGWALRLLSR